MEIQPLKDETNGSDFTPQSKLGLLSFANCTDTSASQLVSGHLNSSFRWLPSWLNVIAKDAGSRLKLLG
jgi:hypothetical protein